MMKDKVQVHYRFFEANVQYPFNARPGLSQSREAGVEKATFLGYAFV
jgi:hypothetical protein